MIPVMVAAVLFLACQESSRKPPAAEVLEPGTIKIITYHADSSISFKSKVPFIMNLARNLGLPVLTGGYRGLYIRVWAWDSSDVKWVIDLKQNRRGNSCTMLSYTTRSKDSIAHIYVHEQREVSPRSGWPDFMRKLHEFHIPEMEADKLSNERKTQFTSMSYVLFEIDQEFEYRYIGYPDPAFFSKEDSACKMVNGFFQYFNSEMGTHIMH